MNRCPNCESATVYCYEVRLSEHPHLAERAALCLSCQACWSFVDFRPEDPDPRLIQWPRPWVLHFAA